MSVAESINRSCQQTQAYEAWAEVMFCWQYYPFLLCNSSSNMNEYGRCMEDAVLYPTECALEKQHVQATSL